MSIKKRRIVAVLGALVATVTIACVVVIADTGERGREGGGEHDSGGVHGSGGN